MRIKGWEKILKFTYIQIVKSKSFIVSTVLMLVIFGLMIGVTNFLPGLLSDKQSKKEAGNENEYIEVTDEEGNVTKEKAGYAIKKVDIYNNSALDIDFSFLTMLKIEYETKIIDGEDEYVQNATEELKNSDEARAITVITETNSGYNVIISRPENVDSIKNSHCYDLLTMFSEAIREANLINLGVSSDDIEKTAPHISTSINVGDEAVKNDVAEAISMSLTMSTSIILFVLILSYGQLTAQAIATEKASRVMELLLTSVKPLAVIVGKVLGTLLVAFTAIITVVIASSIMFMAFAPFGTLGEVFGIGGTNESTVSGLVLEIGESAGIGKPNESTIAALSAELPTAISGFSPVNILLIVIIFIMGFLFYSLIAGLIGASVSKIEDLQTALQPLVLISMLGFYLTYFSTFTGLDPDKKGNILVTISRYLPISSPFALPSAILAGQMTAVEIAVSIGVLALCLVLFALFVAKIYEHIILQNGNRVKIKDMVKLARAKNK
ncbi:MAG: ABC transporter permease [Oscillospiraceae bacterium]|nr:ABC transporter permease [Oscillospiraceae bacterium]